MAYTTFIQTLIVSSIPFLSYIRNKYWGTWLAQSADHVTLGCEFKPHTAHGAYLKK